MLPKESIFCLLCIIKCVLTDPFILHRSIGSPEEYQIISPERCAEESYPKFLHLIHSAPTNKHLRIALRETWANSWTNSLKRVFLVGLSNVDNLVVEEAKEYGDIFYYNLTDAYVNMTLKVSRSSIHHRIVH